MSELSRSSWQRSLNKFRRDKFGLFSLSIVGFYFIVACLAGFGFIGQNWSELLADGRTAPSAQYWFGTTINGQDIFARAVYSTKTAFEIGLIVAFVSTIIGAMLGAIAGYYRGSVVDELILWLCGCLDCIPFYLFVAAVAFALKANPYSMHIAMISTFWMSTCRFVRGEFIKLKELEFCDAARSIGVTDLRIIFKHLLPNTSHILLVQLSLVFVLAIKTEVILSFLGLGVKEGVSWGLMIAESSQEVTSGNFNNFFAASGFMFLLVVAFNMFADSLQDAFDPKKVRS